MLNTNPLGKLDPNGRPGEAGPLQLPHRGHRVPFPPEAHEREVPPGVAGDALDVAAPEEQLRQVGRGDAGRQAAHPQVPRWRRHAPARPPPRERGIRFLIDARAVAGRSLVAPRPAGEPPPPARAAAAPRHLQEAKNRSGIGQGSRISNSHRICQEKRGGVYHSISAGGWRGFGG
jgi:hypothetical protein